jgi:NAD(P)-dependent dehydrogenase (short-subunit alcohol dehydrogenase family)
MTNLENATILITGANGGLGTALVQVALDRGATRVYATAKAPKDWNDDRVVPVVLDLTDDVSIDTAASRATDATILINNAAVLPRANLLDTSTIDLRATLEANLVGPLRLTQALAPTLRGAAGAVVNIASVLSWLAIGKAHSVSKAGLWMATNALRLELAPDGVQVLGVYPGPIDTPMQPAEDRTGMAAPAEVAHAIYDALAAGEHELLLGDLTQKVHAALSAPITALYPQLTH